MFRAKLPSIFNTSHKMPRLPRNLHLVTTWPSPDNAIRKNHDAKWRWTRPKCCACHENWNTSSENIAKVCKSIAPATLNDFRHVTKHVWMSRSAMPATRNEATPHVKPPKVTPFFRTYQRHSHSDLARTVANGCERLRTVADGRGRKRNVERTHPQPPDPQSETGTLATHSGKTVLIWYNHQSPADQGATTSKPDWERGLSVYHISLPVIWYRIPQNIELAILVGKKTPCFAHIPCMWMISHSHDCP